MCPGNDVCVSPRFMPHAARSEDYPERPPGDLPRIIATHNRRERPPNGDMGSRQRAYCALSPRKRWNHKPVKNITTHSIMPPTRGGDPLPVSPNGDSHHGPLQGDMPREMADPGDKPDPAPPSSGQGKTRTGFQQNHIFGKNEVALTPGTTVESLPGDTGGR